MAVDAEHETALREGDLSAALSALQARIRKAPGDAKLRTALFQLLCVMGDWQRAVAQLKLCGELDPAALPMAQTYREAIICEVFREKVFAGERAPLFLGEPPEWLALMAEALKRLAQGDAEAAAGLRARAFEEAPASPGTLDGASFDWIADADSRLGPVLEAIVDGKYFWLPFAAVASIEVDPPEDLRDAVWTPCRITLANEGDTVALIPTRYPGTAANGTDAEKLSRATSWADLGGDAFAGSGQRLLAMPDGDAALMDARSLRMGDAVG